MMLAVEIVGLLFMLTIMFVAIWGFIIFKGMYNQIQYKNYLLEKLIENIKNLTIKKEGNDE